MKIINKTKLGLLLAITVMISQGCDSMLEENPQSEVSDAQFWETEADAQSGVAGIYDAMQEAYSRKYFVWGELRSDNFAASPAGENPEALQLTTNNLNDQSRNYGGWGDMYNVLLRANLAINNIPDISGDVNGLLGQAHAIRAFVYFDLVRTFGDVPLYLDVISGVNDDIYREKTSGEEIMNNLIIPDMLKAEELILNPHEKSRFSLSSVYSLQAEVYMHLKEYAMAKVALDKLEDLSQFTLVNTAEDFHALFRNEPERSGLPTNQMETGTELIFSIVLNIEEDQGAGGIYSLFWAGVPPYFISERLENKWIETFPTDSISWHMKYPDYTPKTVDENTGQTIYGDYFRYLQLAESEKVIGERRYGKYNLTNYSGNEDDTDVVVYRYAGMLLLKAEAELQLGNLEEAANLVNRVRQARDLPGIQLADYATSEELLNVVLDERQFELLAEGKRWWDLIRNDKAVEVMAPINGQGADRLLFPIWFQHLVDNPNLTQTTGY
ncbi:RagB/SusD family nutrient uptake outer membrane protein [Algoriphagus chordae]|uniref:Putative outer membrane starch-binding protein n=1 Tax=Algoriphagus chordae TaxID=237019 RepID=A0A2W7T0V7_9BACT|nr:RagB/SusD family nutrient uptake outer membrane protein [Algoriphagus chordae]PZX56792.1 putative outer membrane starch-binding protein [Algoriphagus chordae]